MNTIAIGAGNIEFSYLDSGVPPQKTSYCTIIAVHGLGFTADIFRKIIALSPKAGIRFIAIARRGYPGSTPLSDDEIAASTTGTDAEKAEFVNTIGFQLAMLIDELILKLALCPLPEDGADGGVALLGWSGGTTWTLSCVANMDQLPLESQNRMKAYMRAHIIQEPPCGCLGLPLPPKIWSPLTDITIPEDQRVSFYIPWITAYFDHGDLRSRDINIISYYAPSIRRAPTIYSMSAEEINAIFFETPLEYEHTVILTTLAQANAVYRKACYALSVVTMLPKMKTSILVGDATCSFSLNALFSIQDDNEQENGGIGFGILPGMNHFMQWDEPEKTLDAYVKAL